MSVNAPYRTSPYRVGYLIGYDTAKGLGAGCRNETAHLRRRLSGLTDDARHRAGADNEADEAAGDDPACGTGLRYDAKRISPLLQGIF